VGIQRPNFQMLMRRHGVRAGGNADPDENGNGTPATTVSETS